MSDNLEAFLQSAGQGCISGHVSEWPQLGPACKYAYNEITRLRAIEDKLSKTADGVVVVPGDKFYCLNYNNIVEAVVPRMCFGPEPIEGRVNGLYWKPERGYSTREAAEAAKENK
jgi:hypothetical protein